MDLLMEHLGKGLFYIILISMPIVLTAAGIGLVVGILQAVTQVQEQTIAAAPKILAVFLVILIGGGIIMKILQNYTIDAINLSLDVVPRERALILPPTGWVDPNKKRRDFFNPKKFIRKGDKPTLEQMIAKPLNSPFLKNENPDPPDVLTPPPPIPDASISEEIDNFKDMRNADEQLRMIPGVEQKTPVIPPYSSPDTNATISILPNLDEPPAINPEDTNIIATDTTTTDKYSTGAAAYLTPAGAHKFDYKVKGSTIIINSHANQISYDSKNINKQNQRGTIILEAE